MYNNKNVFAVKKLSDTQEALSFLNLNLKFNAEADFLFSLMNVAIAQGGLAALAEKTDLGKESIYKALTPHSNPHFSTVLEIIQALGFDFEIVLKKNKKIPRCLPEEIRPYSLAQIHPNIAREWHPS